MDKEQDVTIQIPLPEDSIFEDKRSGSTTENVLVAEKHTAFVFDRVEYPPEGGIYMYLQEVLFPMKGFPFPEAVAAVNLAKRLLISQIRFFAKNPIAGISLLRLKAFEAWLKEYNSICTPILSPYLLKDSYYSNPVREIIKFVRIFLNELGIREEVSFWTAKFLGTLIEYDDAYRYRLEDLASETTAELIIEDPIREFKKILVILKERDSRVHMHERVNAVVLLLRLVLWIPKIRKSFKKAMNSINFKNVQMDEADRYHTLRLTSYKFGGIDDETRVRKYIEIHNGKVPISYPIN